MSHDSQDDYDDDDYGYDDDDDDDDNEDDDDDDDDDVHLLSEGNTVFIAKRKPGSVTRSNNTV